MSGREDRRKRRTRGKADRALRRAERELERLARRAGEEGETAAAEARAALEALRDALEQEPAAGEPSERGPQRQGEEP
jgi:hypothetical protein